jgi:hypothetical protein
MELDWLDRRRAPADRDLCLLPWLHGVRRFHLFRQAAELTKLRKTILVVRILTRGNAVAAKFRIVVIASAALGSATLLAAATAQPNGPGSGMTGRGTMGSWMMGGRGAGGACNPAAAGFSMWRADRLAELIKPTDAQLPKFEELKAASVKSADVMRDACLADVPETIIGRTEAMEKRMEAMLQAVRMVRPALEALYPTLSDEQKARLDSHSNRGRFWHWRDR